MMRRKVVETECLTVSHCSMAHRNPCSPRPLHTLNILFFIALPRMLKTLLLPLIILAAIVCHIADGHAESNALEDTQKPITAAKSGTQSLKAVLKKTDTSYTPTEFLSNAEAFKAEITLFKNEILINWDIAEQYYLYKKRFKFSISDEEGKPLTGVALGTPEFSHPGKIKEDETFGVVEVYYDHVSIRIPINAATQQDINITVGYQGCAEAGLCYPPAKIIQPLTVLKNITPASNPMQANSSVGHDNQALSLSSKHPSKPSTSANPATIELNSNDASSIATYLNEAALLPMLGFFFILGIGLTFTPCVLPMIPILSSTILGQGQSLTATRGFILSCSYVLGMAVAFSLAGLAVGLAGARIQLFMQDPIVLSSFAIVFVLLSLAMFGFYELQLPERFRSSLNNVNAQQKSGNLVGVFIMGALSALIVSPCVSAPLAGILVFIAQEGDPGLGSMALLSLGLGMGAPLIVIATTGANILPKAGNWMNTTKSVFGIALLAVAAYLVRTVLPDSIMMLIWASFFILPAIYMGALDPLEPSASGWKKLWKGVGIMMIVYGIALIWGTAQGNTNPIKPLHFTGTSQVSHPNMAPANRLVFETVNTNAMLSEALASAQAKQPVMIDFYADWCIACVEMEHGAFSDLRSQQRLDSFKLIKVDITKGGEEANTLLDRFGLIGPPSILFFNQAGHPVQSATIMGEMNADQFIHHLDTRVLPYVTD